MTKINMWSLLSKSMILCWQQGCHTLCKTWKNSGSYSFSLYRIRCLFWVCELLLKHEGRRRNWKWRWTDMKWYSSNHDTMILSRPFHAESNILFFEIFRRLIVTSLCHWNIYSELWKQSLMVTLECFDVFQALRCSTCQNDLWDCYLCFTLYWTIYCSHGHGVEDSYKD